MNSSTADDDIHIQKILFPYAFRRQKKLREDNTRFVHYCSAATAMSIIENGTVWLRNALLMNDFSEIEHGQKCLIACWEDDKLRANLKQALDSIQSGLFDNIQQKLNQSHFSLRTQTYILCLSEHGDKEGGAVSVDEDRYGRLSMWRAYGGDTNVALVLNNTPFLSQTNALHAYTSPVFYCDVDDFKTEFATFTDGVAQNAKLLAKVSGERLADLLTAVFAFSILSAKHPGFAEEREWRIIYSPSGDSVKRIRKAHRCVTGVPQIVYEIPLENVLEEGLTGVSIPELLDRLIIGPTPYPLPIFHAFQEKLEIAGVNEPWKRMTVSDIPLRR
ncbi:MAG: DUF2971 domain-containing protein [Rhodobacteraceae bacterium]|nr:DUF2971 domain-containing protein [Paracoccaceae bacterium]